MKIYACTINVTLSQPFYSKEMERQINGYYRNWHLRVSSIERAKALIEEHTSDGTIDWCDSSVRVEADSPGQEEVLHSGGRVFY
jgi:hypothetical protein